jgi:hypothetical protein
MQPCKQNSHNNSLWKSAEFSCQFDEVLSNLILVEWGEGGISCRLGWHLDVHRPYLNFSV